MDIRVTNDGTQDLRWNSTVLRMIVPAGMLPVGGTYSFQCVGAGDFPLSWPAVLPANAFGANYAAATRTITWTTGNTSAYNNLTCTAPLIPMGATMTIARFSFKCTNNNFVSGQNATFTWSATSSCNLYQTSPTCAAAVTGFSTTVLRTQAPPCIQAVPNACAVTGSSVVTDPACFGGTGSAVVTLTGTGAGAPGTYSLDGGPATPYASNPFTVSGLSNGAHSIVATVTAGGCVSTAIAANVTEPAALSGSQTGGTAVSCVGSTDGTADITLSASTSGTYSIDGGPSTNNYSTNPFTVSGLGAGAHTIVATSAAGCVSNLIGVNVGTAAAFTGTTTSTPTTCGNPTSGTITVTLSSGTSGTYTLDGGAATPYNTNPFTITGVTGGPHTVVATSSAGCVSNSMSETVGSTATFTATVVKTNITACNVGNDGTITVTPNGGQAPFTYVWSGGYPGFAPGNVSSVTNLPIGFYNVTVTSAGGCGSATFTNIHVQFAFFVFVTNSGTASSSCGNTGSITLFGNAGVLPYTYALSAGSGQPTPAPGAFQVSNAFTGLAAGSYTGFVKDAGGCVSAKNITVSAISAVVANPFAVASSSCNADGSIQIFKSGGVGPFMYSLDGGPYQTSNFFPGLAAGPYTANVKDGNGCIGSASVTVGQGAGLTVTAFKTNTSSCATNGTIQVNVTGGVAPYTYSINGGLYQVSNTFSGLGASTYAISVKDFKNCTGSLNVTINTNTINVTASAVSASSCAINNGSIQLFRTGGTGPYTYSLDGNTYQPSTIFTGLAAGTYDGYVKDAFGCIGVLNGIVVGPTGCAPPPIAGGTKYSAPVAASASITKVNAYPNPSSTGFTLQLDGYNMTERVSVTITDLLGRKVYQTEGKGKMQYRFGTEFIKGMYNVQVIQGSIRRA